jgi:hypothetical protein
MPPDPRHGKWNSDQTEVLGLLILKETCTAPRREQMTTAMTDLDAYTEEELEKLARVLVHARGEVLNDAEVQQFWQFHKEISRRSAASGSAA